MTLNDVQDRLNTYACNLWGKKDYTFTEVLHYFRKRFKTPGTLGQFGLSAYFPNLETFNETLKLVYQEFNVENVSINIQAVVLEQYPNVIYILSTEDLTEANLTFIKNTLKIPSVSTLYPNVLALNY